MSSHAEIKLPRLPTDTGLAPDAARAVLADVERLSEAAQHTEATIKALAAVINKRQKHGFYGLGGGFGLLVALVWSLASEAYSSYQGLQDTVAKQGQQIEAMQRTLKEQQRALNVFYREALGNRARPVEIDALTAPDAVTGPSPLLPSPLLPSP